jgi:hypothetical protein
MMAGQFREGDQVKILPPYAGDPVSVEGRQEVWVDSGSGPGFTVLIPEGQADRSCTTGAVEILRVDPVPVDGCKCID